jgi:hypothetical protein
MTLKRTVLLMAVILGPIMVFSCTFASHPTEETATLFSRPEPTPAFLFNVSPLPGASVTSPQFICASINQSEVWEEGNQADQLSEHLVSNTKMVIDDHPVSRDNTYYYDPFDLIAKPTGTSSSYLSVCTKQNLEKGIHRVVLETSTLSGKRLIYSWAFELI